MNRIVVTGATGMLGSHLIEYAEQNNVHVVAVVRENSNKLNNIVESPLVEIVECDFERIDCLAQKVSEPCDVFFHFAWMGVYGTDRNNPLLQSKNAQLSLGAIQVAHEMGCSKFVFAGSQAEYGIQQSQLRHDTIENPITPYGIAKNYVTKLGMAIAKHLGMEFCTGRILSAFGKRDTPTTMLSSMMTKMIKGEECNLSPCTHQWDYIYAKDVARAFYMIGEKGVHGKAYPIASGVSRPLKEFVLSMYDIVGNDQSKINFGAVELGNGAVNHLSADISELRNDTGFASQYSFEEGIGEILQEKKLVMLQGGKE